MWLVFFGDRIKHREKLFKTPEEIQEAGYRASEKKSEHFLKKTFWLVHVITEHGTKPNKEKIKTKLQLRPTTSCEELKSIIGAIQYIAKFIPKL